jgi:hypothetical protein
VLEKSKPSSGGEKKNHNNSIFLERYNTIVEDFSKKEESSCFVFF